ncbi:hypothetical protein P3W85_19200 [Cupriavidus basilensis]|uniref:Transmembrane protein n=1 Tax=Cupriavidus basilensis TaxID=68895 RepID=A0ABT6AR11_9BURK|nr:hypothetical protein [Cupriavidus basilensis]MDF3835069.1 hypothetical protein [Cupriavidus basilensis]
MKRRNMVLGVLAAAVFVPASILAFVKPLRAAAPQFVPGVHCVDSGICIDDMSRLEQARTLYSAAVDATSRKVGPFHKPPSVVFCATNACREDFGLGNRAAAAVADWGVAIAPRGWKPYFVVHELIHFRQAEELGNIALLRKPKWLIEGMAYSLSDDPRRPLTQPFEDWRSRFEAWNAARGDAGLWQAADRVE